MSLINNNEAYVQNVNIRPEQLRSKPFRRQIEKFVVPVGRVVQSQIHLVAAHSGMDRKGSHSPVVQILDLILHEGDERSDDQSDTIPHQTRNLETD